MTPDGARVAPPRGHLPALDGVRGIAILLVLGHQLNLPGEIDGKPMMALHIALNIGWIGVQLFFVLSGYLITGILLDAKGAPGYFRAFYLRRALRIFPLYYALLAAMFLALPAVGAPAQYLPERANEAWYWLYLQNWAFLGPHGPMSALPHTWSLAVEEQFYLLWPIVVAALSPRSLARLCAGLCAFAVASRVVMLEAWGASPGVVYQLTPGRLDALALGALVALGERGGALGGWVRFARRPAVWVPVLAGFLVHIRYGGFRGDLPANQTLGFTAYALVFAALVAIVVEARGREGGPLVRALSWAPLRTFGKYSYAIYIMHMPLHHLARQTILAGRFPAPTDASHALLLAAYLPAATVVLLGLGALSWRVLEGPVLRLKDRIPWGVGRPVPVR